MKSHVIIATTLCLGWVGSVAAEVIFSETFEAYAPGSNLVGQGGWVGQFGPNDLRVGPGTGLSTQVLDGALDIATAEQSYAGRQFDTALNPGIKTTLLADAFAIGPDPRTTVYSALMAAVPLNLRLMVRTGPSNELSMVGH